MNKKEDQKSSNEGRRNHDVAGHSGTDDSSKDFDAIRDIIFPDSADGRAKFEAYHQSGSGNNNSSSSSSSIAIKNNQNPRHQQPVGLRDNITTSAPDRLRPMTSVREEVTTVASELSFPGNASLFRGPLYPQPEEGQNTKLQEQDSFDNMLMVNKETNSGHDGNKIDASDAMPSKSTYPLEKPAMDQGNVSDSFDILTVVQERASGTSHELGGYGWTSSFPTHNNGHGVQNMPPQPRRPPQQSQPGAYTAAPGITTDRVDKLNFSLLGAPLEPTPPTENDVTTREDNNTMAIRTPSTTLPYNNNYNEDLTEATPVESEQFGSSMMEARPVDQENLDQKAIEEAHYKRWTRFAFGFVALACLVLIVSLAIGLTNKEELDVVFAHETAPPAGSPTGSPTMRPLPPMDNLELLYDELPEKTKENLYNHMSPQYQAWEWLLDHPNITTYPEWRKRQIFAMVTFFLSFEGPNWPELTPNRDKWMNVNTSECSWIMTNVEAAYLYQEVTQLIGPDAYEDQDWQPCNKNGEIQMLAFNQIFLPSHLKPTIPPEIRFLTSLKMIGFAFGQINMKFSDLLSEELLQLPHLEGITLSNNGARGTIPKTLGMLTRLRHLLVNANKLTGTIPSDIAMMSSLEYISLGYEEKLFGKLPSELGLMTTLTGLNIYGSSFTGTIPTELGSLSGIKVLALDKNKLTGDIPSELGLLTRSTRLSLFENRLNGSLASELGLMTNTLHLRIWNNALTGSIPSEIGLMTNIIDIRLGNDLTQTRPYNNFSGYLPTALWGLSHMEELFLPNLPNLRGQLPSEILMPNLTLLSLSGSQLAGTIPDQVCIFVEELDFDCSDLLCGCGCPCAGSINKTNLP